MNVLYFIFFVNLVIVCYQDFKERAVFLISMVVLLFTGAGIHYMKSTEVVIFFYTVAVNFVVVIILTLILFAYSKFKLKKKISETIGVGDLLFFIVLAVSFSTVSFLIIFSFSLFFSLILFLLLKPILKKDNIPLAGLQALFLVLFLAVNHVFKIVDLYAV